MSSPEERIAEPSAGAAGKPAALVFIFGFVLMDVVSLGIIIPVFARLVESFSGGDTAHAAMLLGFFSASWALMQFFFSPIIGMISDRYGRRPVLLISCFGLGLDYMLMAVAPSLAWLYLGRIISGITMASFSTAGAYLADISPPEKRASMFGMLGAMWGVGFILGPALGGVLGEADPRLPFWVASGLTLVNAMYGLFVLPESLPRNRRTPFFNWRRANPIGSLQLLRSHPELLGFAGVMAVLHLVQTVYPSVFVLYSSYRYGWGELTTGLTMAISGACMIVVQGFMVKRSVAKFGERRTLMFGIFCGIIGFIWYGLAGTGAMFWAGMPIMALAGLYGPAIQGLMTRFVQPSEQGQLQGANSSIMGITGLVGPLIFTQVFSHAIDPDLSWHVPGAAFLLAGFFLMIALLMAWRVTRRAAPSSESGNRGEADTGAG